MVHDPTFFNRFAIFMVAFSTIVFPLIIWGVIAMLGRIVKFFSPIAAHYIYLVAITAGVFVLFVMLVGHFWGPKHLVVRNETVKSNVIPDAFNDYKIVHFSDLHLISQQWQPEFVQTLVETINAQQPDIICFTGDLVTGNRLELTPYKNLLCQLKAKDGVYSVLGNHDYHIYTGLKSKEQAAWIKQFVEDQHDLEWNVLLNESKVICRGNDSICIAGCENDGTPPHFPQYANLDKTFSETSNICCKILLSHDPTHWQRSIIKDTDVVLTLSGHTHAMQFKIFGWSPSTLLYKEWYGLYSTQQKQGNKAEQYLNVSSGVGGAGLPFRFGAWPEICVVTLKKQ